MTCSRFHRVASSLLLTAMLSGCVSQQTIRVVDAKSGEPLGDVRVERLEGSYHASSVPFIVFHEFIPAEKQVTNDSGTANFQTSGSHFMVNPSHDNPLYSDAFVKLTWSGAKVRYNGTNREVSVRRKDGVIQIPLHGDSIDSRESHGDKLSQSSRDELR